MVSYHRQHADKFQIFNRLSATSCGQIPLCNSTAMNAQAAHCW